MNKFYKLNVGFKPWWCEQAQQCYPSKHIETILKEVYGEDYYEDDVDLQLWKEIKNVQYTKDYVYLEDVEENIPLYLKYISGKQVYYYYLYSKDKITVINKEGKTIYAGVYFLDKYMTIYFHKLNILFQHNPMVKFNYKYCVPWIKIDDNNYKIDFVEKKELSSYINDINYEMVRKEIFSITEKELYEQLPKKDELPYEWLNKPSNTGRYRYIVLKSSALVKWQIDKLSPAFVTQDIIIVPLYSDGILNEINNIEIEEQQKQDTNFRKIIIGDNFIGIYECDIPYSFLYGLHLNDPHNVDLRMDSVEVPYFIFPLNYYNRNVLIKYTNYSKGFYGKLKYIFENWDKVIPETEVALLAPQYYRETYNNGSGSITNDFSKFIFIWNKNVAFEFNLYITVQFDNELGIAYNYGNNTNTQLASYDNTNVEVSNVSVPIGLTGSAATQYYSNNLNTSLTAIKNRELEQEQARRNRDFDSGKDWANFIGNAISRASNLVGIKSFFNPGKIGAAVAETARDLTVTSINTAQRNYNYIDDQIRANRNLYTQVNNIYSSPNINLSNPYIKGVIPNEKNDQGEYKLFKHYACELHPYDKKLIFAKILDEGYIYNCVDRLNSFIVRKYMNILNINPYMHYSHLLGILKNNDNTFFNSPKDYQDFFIWLAIPKKIYNTNNLINVLDWEEDDYIDNIFIEKIPIITPLIHIEKLQWNFPNWLPYIWYDYETWKKEILDTLKELNKQFNNILWDNIDITIDKKGAVIIKVINKNEKYVGQTFFECNFWWYRYREYSDSEWIYVDNASTIPNIIKEIGVSYLEICYHDFRVDRVGNRHYVIYPIYEKNTKIGSLSLLYFYTFCKTNGYPKTYVIWPNEHNYIGTLDIYDIISLKTTPHTSETDILIYNFNVYINKLKTIEAKNLNSIWIEYDK